MANYGSSITFNSIDLNVLSISPVKTQKNRKVVLGKSLSQVSIIGLNDTQWELNVSGIVIGSNLTDLATKRAQIEALDDITPHAFVDGIHNGTYVLIPGSLHFTDSGERGNISYSYSFNLVEE